MSTREQYRRYSLITIVIGSGIMLFRQITPFLSGLLGALIVYILVRCQMIYLSEERKMKRNIAAAIITTEAILCLLIPLALVVWLAVINLQNINPDLQTITALFEQTAAIIKIKTGYNILGGDGLSLVLSFLPRIGQTLVDGISDFVVNMFMFISVLYFMLIGGEKIERYVNGIPPLNEINAQNAVHKISMTIRSNAIGTPLLTIIQDGAAMIGYRISGAPNILFSGFLTELISVVPVVGTALIWVPVVTYITSIGNRLQVVGLAAFGALVISQLDDPVCFIIQEKMADVHPLTTIFGVVIGPSFFGFVDVISSLLLLSPFFLFVDMFEKGYLDGEK